MTGPTENRRVLIVRNAMPFDFGGAERFAVDLADELQQNDWQPLVISHSKKLLSYAEQQNLPHKKGWWWNRQNWSGKHALLFPAYVIWQLLLTCWYLSLIVRFRPHVVHPQSKDDFIAATLAAKLVGKRVVWTDHADLKYIFANHTVWYKNPVGKLVYLASKLADAITLVSDSEHTLISRALDRELGSRFIVVHNGVKTPNHIEPCQKDPASFVFCATSRLVSAKGIAELIDAFKALRTRLDRIELWLVGDGPEAALFKEQTASTPGIQFLGHSDFPLSFVAGCDVFVHPSYHEGFSLSLIEAAMLGKPIVACNVGGNPEIVKEGNTGILVPARNIDALEAAMQELYDNRELGARLGANAQKLFEEQFRFEKIVKEKFIKIYEDR